MNYVGKAKENIRWIGAKLVDVNTLNRSRLRSSRRKYNAITSPPAFCTSASPKSLVHSTSWMSAFASGAWFCTEGGQKRVDISIGGATRTHKLWPHLTQEVESHNTGNSVSHTLRKRDKSLIMSSGVLKGKINKTQIKKKKVRVTLKVRAV